MDSRRWGNATSGKGYMKGQQTSQDSGTSKGAGSNSLSIRPASGPGEGTTRASLKSFFWETIEGKTRVLEFYGHHPTQQYGCFSNFFAAPFLFVVPEELCGFPVSLEERTVACDFSEKAIMLCKAAAMGDRHSYDKIRASSANAAAIKKMGREVRGFDGDLWMMVECSVAFEAVYQKFLKVSGLKEVLLATWDCVLAEATSNDRNWGTGLDKGDNRNRNPSQWLGTNMLGWALMEARKALGTGSVLALPLANACSATGKASSSNDLEGYSVAASILPEQEKAFMKVAKKARELLKLEADTAAGVALDKMQLKKLEGKHDLFLELSALEVDLPQESECRAKNEEVLMAVATYFSTS